MNHSHVLRTVCVVAALLVSVRALAGGERDTTFRLIATVGVGGSFYSTTAGFAPDLQADVSKFGPAATVRVMWQPDHLLGVGLETGWSKFYSYEISGSTPGSVYVSQVPLYIVWSMKPWGGITLFGGYGYSRVNTSLEYQGTVNAGTWSMGWVAAGSYEWPLAKNLGIAGEVKWINAVESHDATLSLQVQLVYSFFEY
jgi:hypothetical protein